ncbi:hypothetical protein C2S53_002957 [Perilla frutescens var. hirtella]|uniref:DNA-directed RNA polymerase III subunit RPC3 n=1 Tax=Perilla frutescens var. hirtella TaxID=608512 RepID=A0AAD4JKX8_PERFH|nr:hypothetical protein C2S53_002957 [Perilla frutescens var. hirtella]
MVLPHGIPLAVHLISTFYGDLCSKVCECLLRRGTLTSAQIIRFTGLSKEHVFNCLRVLTHQNCVQAFTIQQEGAIGDAPRIFTHYMAIFDNIINKLRATKFMHIVSEELGEDCLDIFQGLIQHGRLSLDQIIDRVNQKTGSSNVEAVHNSFRRLLSARFIERCPAPEPFLAPLTEEETRAKKRGAKSGKIAEQQTIEQRALAAAAPAESMRFAMEIGDISERMGEESTNSPTVGEKRKKDVSKSDEDVLDRRKEVLWRVNFEEFVLRLLHKACISYVKTRINNEASIVLSAILDLSQQSETRLKAEKSPYLSINDIYDEVIKKDGGVGMDLERVQTSLDQLGCQTLSTDIDESYSVDIKSIIQMAQNEEVESMILKRYGKEAYRIFRLLSKAGRLVETDKISDSTFVEKKETVQILFKLWKDEYLHMEKITTTGARQSTFNLWKVDQQRLGGTFLDEMYHALLNLRLRIIYEQERGKEAILLPNDKHDDKQQNKFMIYRVVRATLERSLMNLDEAVVLFHHF